MAVWGETGLDDGKLQTTIQWLRVKSGKAQTEQMMSAFHPTATEQRTQFYVGFVPQADVDPHARFGVPQGVAMARVFISGSSTGLGLASAALLADEGHQVVLHARNPERADLARAALPRASAVVQGDVSRIAGA
ncbi:MAG: hypothetical protein WBL84_03585, partial [Xanthobacteraceae bacterium]